MSRVRIQTNTTLSTSTGTLPALDLYQVCGTIAADVSHASTKQVAWKLQGSLAGVSWVDILAATSSTGDTQAVSTASGLWNQVRIVVTANGTTGNVVTTWSVAGKP